MFIFVGVHPETGEWRVRQHKYKLRLPAYEASLILEVQEKEGKVLVEVQKNKGGEQKLYPIRGAGSNPDSFFDVDMSLFYRALGD